MIKLLLNLIVIILGFYLFFVFSSHSRSHNTNTLLVDVVDVYLDIEPARPGPVCITCKALSAACNPRWLSRECFIKNCVFIECASGDVNFLFFAAYQGTSTLQS